SIIDPDSANFDTGVFTAQITNGSDANDLLEIRNDGIGAGQIGVSGSNVTFGGTVIGTFAGGAGAAPLVVTFYANATPAAATALLNAITYRSTSTTPPVGARTVQFTVTDGDGGTSNMAPRSVIVGDFTPPTVQSITRASTNPTNASTVNYTVTF